MEIRFIPPEVIDKLLIQANIVDIIDTRVPLKKAGKDYQACCPFHTERSASFTVSESKQFYHCFGCGAHGTAISFIMEYEALTFVDAALVLADEVNMDLSHLENKVAEENVQRYRMMREITRIYQKNLSNPNNPAAEMLKARGIESATVDNFMLGYSLESWDHIKKQFNESDLMEMGMLQKHEKGHTYDLFRNRLMFPIRDRGGEVIGFAARALDDSKAKYINSPEHILFKKEETLYGLYENRRGIREKGRAIVVEGQMDAIALSQAGFPQAVASMGTALTSKQLSQLSRYTSNIVFCMDGDSAGIKSARKSLETLLPIIQDHHRISYLFLQDGHDPDSFIRENEPSAFEALINSATPLSDELLNHLLDGKPYHHLEDKLARVKDVQLHLDRMAKAPQLASLIRQAAARRLEVPVETLAPEQDIVEDSPRVRPSPIKVMTPTRRALSILLNYPIAVAEVLKTLQIPQLSQSANLGHQLIIEIAAIAAQKPDITAAGVLTRYRDNAEVQDMLSKLLMIDIHEASIAAQEFKVIMRNLEEEIRMEKSRELLSKPFEALTESDMAELKVLGLI